jgi:hypothetical protein
MRSLSAKARRGRRMPTPSRPFPQNNRLIRRKVNFTNKADEVELSSVEPAT